MDIRKNTGALIRAILIVLLAGSAALLLHGALPRSEAAAPEATPPATPAAPETQTAPLAAAEERGGAERRKNVRLRLNICAAMMIRQSGRIRMVWKLTPLM